MKKRTRGLLASIQQHYITTFSILAIILYIPVLILYACSVIQIGDLLVYTGSYLAAAGTIFLGVVTIIQTHRQLIRQMDIESEKIRLSVMPNFNTKNAGQVSQPDIPLTAYYVDEGCRITDAANHEDGAGQKEDVYHRPIVFHLINAGLGSAISCHFVIGEKERIQINDFTQNSFEMISLSISKTQPNTLPIHLEFRDCYENIYIHSMHYVPEKDHMFIAPAVLKEASGINRLRNY